MMTFNSEAELTKVARTHPEPKLAFHIAVDDSKVLNLEEPHASALLVSCAWESWLKCHPVASASVSVNV